MSKQPASQPETKVLLHTSMGDITIALRSDMPITTGNFKKLVEKGTFNGTIFHRVIPGFMIQGGDPTGTGYGDPSIPEIKDEFTRTNRNDKGTIAMANAGPNTGSSQFFINQANNNFLDNHKNIHICLVAASSKHTQHIQVGAATRQNIA